MSFLAGIGDLLKQYSAGGGTAANSPAVPSSTLAGGLAEAFRSGNLGVMDYYRMKNVQADTSMRESIAGTDKPRTEGT